MTESRFVIALMQNAKWKSNNEGKNIEIGKYVSISDIKKIYKNSNIVLNTDCKKIVKRVILH